MPLAVVEKRRIGNQDKTEVMSLIGDVEGMDVIIIDDECDTAEAHRQRCERGFG